MGGNDTTDDDERVQRLIDGAKHASVTRELLTGEQRYDQGFSLYDDPAVAHLDPDEQPHFLFFNEMKGVGIDRKRNTTRPDGQGLTLMLVTDRRTLVLVGQADGDEVFEAPHGAVQKVTYSTGMMKHRITLATTGRTYHLWIDTSFDEADLQAAVEYLRTTRERPPTEPGADPTDDATGPGADPDPDPDPDPDADATAEGITPAGDGGDTDADEADPTAAFTFGEAADDGRATTDDAPDDPTARHPDASSGGATPNADATPDAGEDPLETLDRLKQLHDRGVVTDEEFQEKKRELLDQI